MSVQQTGSAWESKVVKYLSERGLDARRSEAREGRNDIGDVVGLGRWALDCKDHARFALATWVKQARQERVNARKPLSAVIVRRRGGRVEDAYVVMDLATFATLENYINEL